LIKLPSPKTPEYALTLPLAIVCLVFGAALVIESTMMGRSESSVATNTAQPEPGATTPDAGADAVFQLPPIDEFSAFVDRPLFMEGRKPAAEVNAPEAPKEEDLAPLALSLMGVMLSPRGQWAIVAEASGKHRRVKLGGTIAGWRLIELKPDHVTVQRGEEKRDLPLMKPRTKGAATPGAPPGPAGALPPGVRRGPRQPVPPPQPAPEEIEPDADENPDDATDADEPPESEAEE
jgi:hypothetical protein